jgi:tetratricopeptide (TPR) repeat protein
MLVQCSFCGKRISDRAPSCPFCKTPPPRGAAPPPEPAPAPVPEAPATPRPAVDSLPSFAPGDFIGPSLQVLRVLGEGGFGIVYLAQSLQTQMIHAVKTIRAELLRDRAGRELFRREAGIWIALGNHPYLVRAHFLEEIHGRFYLAMEYIAPDARGLMDLQGHLRRHPVVLSQALRWAIQFCHGMEYALSKGITAHRDIKPANILVDERGTVRITDFGIAGTTAVPEKRGASFGTPTHMPPEQFVDASRCDERSDIYAFGVVLYQMAAGGNLPFSSPALAAARGDGGLLWKTFETLHRTMEPAGLDTPLWPVIARCLRKSPGERYPGFAALRADLEALLLEKTGKRFVPEKRESMDAWEHSNRGNSLGSLGRWEEALQSFDKALLLSPDSAAIRNNRGNALRQLGRIAEAIAEFERAISLEALFSPPWLNKGLALAGAGRDAEALAAFDRALELDPRQADAWVSRGVVLGRLDRAGEELASYDRALQVDPREPLALLNKANLLLSAGRPAEALAAVEASLASNPLDANAWMVKGLALGQLGKAPEAVGAFDEAVRLEPENGQAWYNRGNAMAAVGDFAEARRAFAEAAQLVPDFPLAWYNLGLAEMKLGKNGQAAAALRHFLAIAGEGHPMAAGATMILGRIDAGGALPTVGGFGATVDEQGREVDRVAIPAEAVPPGPPAPGPAEEAPDGPLPATPPDSANEMGAHNDRCTEFFGQGRFQEALSEAEAALALEPANTVALNNKANCLFRLGRGEEALAIHERILLDDPFYIPAWMNRGMIQVMLGHPAAGRRSLRDGLRLAGPGDEIFANPSRDADARLEAQGVAPAAPDAFSFLAAAVAAGGAAKWPDAVASIERGVTAAPRSGPMWRWKGVVLLESGQLLPAVAALDQALALDGRDVVAWHKRGLALGRLQRHREAVASYDRATALDPRHAASWSDRGKTLSTMGRFAEAVESLARASEVAPGAAAPWQNRALAEERLGREADALRSWRAYLERAGNQSTPQVTHARARVVELEARLKAAGRQG